MSPAHTQQQNILGRSEFEARQAQSSSCEGKRAQIRAVARLSTWRLVAEIQPPQSRNSDDRRAFVA